MITSKFVRKPFLVDAVQVTAENMQDIAKWAMTEVRMTPSTYAHGGKKGAIPYVHIRVLRPLNEKQSMAFEGDWVLYAGTGYKVYSNKAFKETFDAASDGDNPYYVAKLSQPTVVEPSSQTIPEHVYFQDQEEGDDSLGIFQEAIHEAQNKS